MSESELIVHFLVYHAGCSLLKGLVIDPHALYYTAELHLQFAYTSVNQRQSTTSLLLNGTVLIMVATADDACTRNLSLMKISIHLLCCKHNLCSTSMLQIAQITVHIMTKTMSHKKLGISSCANNPVSAAYWLSDVACWLYVVVSSLPQGLSFNTTDHFFSVCKMPCTSASVTV